ncbi:MAG: DUF2267 domain-containing protein [Thermoleophilia bacterium]|nr:DUF2267 domain-containing protein [Thermoleophilia bacterium]
MTEPSIIERSVEKAHIWLNEMAEQLGTEDHQEAYRALRAYLHALRDLLRGQRGGDRAATPRLRRRDRRHPRDPPRGSSPDPRLT